MFFTRSITVATQWPMFKYKSPFSKSIYILKYWVGKKRISTRFWQGHGSSHPEVLFSRSVLRWRSWIKRPTVLALFFFLLSSSDSFIPGARLEHISFYHQSDPLLFLFQKMIYQKSGEDNQLCFPFHGSQLEFQQFPPLLEYGFAYQNCNSCPQTRKQLWRWNPHMRWGRKD